MAENSAPLAFNLNDIVRVKLTFEGLRILKERDDELRKRAPKLSEWRVPKTDKDGWSEFQLWVLMQAFGPHIYMGGRLPFGTTMELVDARPASPV